MNIEEQSYDSMTHRCLKLLTCQSNIYYLAFSCEKLDNDLGLSCTILHHPLA